MSLTIKEWMKICFDVAESKGWHDMPLVIEKELMNFHAEISEAWEELRKGKPIDEYYFGVDESNYHSNIEEDIKGYKSLYGSYGSKPEGFPIELADLAIRLFHTCAYHGIDLEKYMELKTEYNKTRGYRHGNKTA